jgi:hypothetical protein
MASSTARQFVRIRERRALFTAVRLAIVRVAFLPDAVLAMGFRNSLGRREAPDETEVRAYNGHGAAGQ